MGNVLLEKLGDRINHTSISWNECFIFLIINLIKAQKQILPLLRVRGSKFY